MKSLIFVVLAFAAGLAQSALIVQHRLQSQGKENGSFEKNRLQFVAAMQKTHLYKKGLSFVKWFLQKMRKTIDHNRYVNLYKKPSTNRWLRYELRALKKKTN